MVCKIYWGHVPGKIPYNDSKSGKQPRVNGYDSHLETVALRATSIIKSICEKTRGKGKNFNQVSTDLTQTK